MTVFSFTNLRKIPLTLSILALTSLSVYAQEGPVVVDDAVPLSIPGTEELNTADGESTSSSGPSISAPSARIADEELNDFFDANDLVPQGEMTKDGPNRVNPSSQPASKLVVVKKNYTADSKTAQLVSAERAMSLGLNDSALQMFDNLYAVNKKDSRILMGRAVVLQKIGRFDEAMQMYEKLSILEPKNIDVKVNMLGLLGTRYPSVALRRLIELHNKNTSHVGLTAQIAIAYAQAGDVNSAMKFLGVAASMEPNNANHLFNMAVIADRAGSKKQAISFYEKALETDTIHGAGRTIPRDTVYERLAQIR